MGIFDWLQNGFFTGAKSFVYRSSAREHFSKKYAFMGERLQKLCSNNGLKSVEAEVNTGEWFLEMRMSDNSPRVREHHETGWRLRVVRALAPWSPRRRYCPRWLLQAGMAKNLQVEWRQCSLLGR